MGVDVIAYRKPQKQDEGDQGFLGGAAKALGAVGSVAALIPGAQPIAAGIGALETANSLSKKQPSQDMSGGTGANVSTSGGAMARRLQDQDEEKAKKLAGLA